MEDNNLLRSIPKVDEVLRSPALSEYGAYAGALTGCVRDVLGGLRSGLLSGSISQIPSMEEICGTVRERMTRTVAGGLTLLINASGVILHTNFGRAPLAEAAAEAAYNAALNYSDLEYDLERGGRGSRYSHIEPMLCALTGCEAAIAVNNNAAAVLLMLTALGKGREVIVSRGELVEIGGSFRIPDIMESCGCILREVGTTNKTRLSDYDRAVNENTFALMKIHTSNYRIIGFTQSVSTAEMSELAHSRGLPMIEDLGSGVLLKDLSPGLDEPSVAECLKAGADLVSFSGDKLLGGPQAGIIVGKREYIDIIRSCPLLRAMRLDKMTLAAIEATLRLYLTGRAAEEIPVISMLTAKGEELHARALKLAGFLKERGVRCRIVPMQGQTGGGSAPGLLLEGWGVVVDCNSPNTLEKRLRFSSPPVIGRIVDDVFCLDVRTMFDRDLAAAAKAVAEVIA